MTEHLPDNRDSQPSHETEESKIEYQKMVEELAETPAFDQIGRAIHNVSKAEQPIEEDVLVVDALNKAIENNEGEISNMSEFTTTEPNQTSTPPEVAPEAVDSQPKPENNTESNNEDKERDWLAVTERDLTGTKDRLATAMMDGLSSEETNKLQDRQTTLEETKDYILSRPESGEKIEVDAHALPNEEAFHDGAYEDMSISELHALERQAQLNNDETSRRNIEIIRIAKELAEMAGKNNVNTNPESNQTSAPPEVAPKAIDSQPSPENNTETSSGNQERDWLVITERDLTSVKDRLATAMMDGLSNEEIDELKARQTTLEETKNYILSRPESGEKIEVDAHALPNEEAFHDGAYEDMSISELHALERQAQLNNDETSRRNIEIIRIAKELAEMAGVNNGGEKDPIDGEKDPTDGEDDPTDGEDDPTDGEDDPTDGEDDPEDPEKPNFNLVLVGGKSKEGDLERMLLSAAKEADEKEQQSLRLKECKNVIKWVKGRIKYNSLFKLNTNTTRAKKLIDTLRTEADGKPLTFEDLSKALATEGSPLPETVHQAFLEAIAENLDTLGMSVLVDGKTATKVRESSLAYVTAISSTGLSEKQRAEIHARHSAEISEILATANGAEANELKVYADNASEILTTLSASALHQEGLASVESMIQDMEVRVGEGRIGANNHEDITYLRKVDKLGQKYNVGSAIGKASFVASTWIATGVASGLAVRGAKQTATMTTGAIIGSAFAPGIGTLVGVGVSTVAAGAWGRYMGRRRASEQGSMASTNVEKENSFNLSRRGKREIQPYLNEAGDYRSDLSPDELTYAQGIVEREKTSSTLEKLKPEQMSMTEGISFLMRFMQPVAGLERDESGDPIDWDANDISNYEIKPDLTPNDAYLLSQYYAKVKTTMDFEDSYNQQSEQIANLDAGRNVLTKTLKSSKDIAGFALNLFSASGNENYLSEKVTLAMLVQNIGRTIETDTFKNQTISSVDDSGEPYETRAINIGEVMNLVAEQTNVECETNVKGWRSRVDSYITKTGRRTGLVSGGVALAAGLASATGMAYITEKATGGKAQTVLDILNPKKYDIQPQPRPMNVIEQAGNITFDDGVNQFNIPKNSDGSIDPVHINTLKQAGIEVVQTPHTQEITIPAGESLKLDGGFEQSVSSMAWADNNTYHPDFSEQGLHFNLGSKGEIIIDQFDLGGRTSHVVTNEINQGNVLLRFVERLGNDKEVILLAGPAQSVNGKGRWVIEASDVLYKYFNINNGQVTPAVHSIGSTLKRFGEPLTSIATELGKSSGGLTETITTFTTKATSRLVDTAGKLSAFATGLYAPSTKSVRGDNMKKPGTPNGQEPTPEPTPAQEFKIASEPQPVPEPVEEQPASQESEPAPTQEEPIEEGPEWAKQLYRETAEAMKREQEQKPSQPAISEAMIEEALKKKLEKEKQAYPSDFESLYNNAANK